jgi:hypothetical protein
MGVVVPTWGGEGSVCRASRPGGQRSQGWQWRSQGAQRQSAGPRTHLSEPRPRPSEGSSEPRGSSPPISQTLPAFSSFLIVDRTHKTDREREREKENDGKWKWERERERERERALFERDFGGGKYVTRWMGNFFGSPILPLLFVRIVAYSLEVSYLRIL